MTGERDSVKNGSAQMARPRQSSFQVEAELITGMATTRLVWFEMDGSPNHSVMWDNYYLDLSLTPRPVNMRACFPNRWSPQRFASVGDMLLIPPGEPVHIRADTPFRQTSIICELDPVRVHDLIGFEIDWNDRRIEAGLDLASSSIRHLLRKLAEEAREPGIASNEFVDLVTKQLAIEIGRHMETVDEAPVTGGLAPWRLRIIDDRLKIGGEFPTLVDLAELCSLSVRQLTRGFKKSRGCTIGDYVTQMRLESAKRRLSAGESIKLISHELGYTSPSSFSYAFRRSVGLTPRQFLNRVYRSK